MIVAVIIFVVGLAAALVWGYVWDIHYIHGYVYYIAVSLLLAAANTILWVVIITGIVSIGGIP